MPELAEQLRTYVDEVAAPIPLDEITGVGDTPPVAADDDAAARGARRVHRGFLIAAAIVLVLAFAAGVVVVAHRSTGPSRVVAGPRATASTTPSSQAWLTPYGTATSAPPVPAGWKVLDVADFRFAVPAGWTVPATPCTAGALGATGRVVVVTTVGPLPNCQNMGPLPASELLLVKTDRAAPAGTSTTRWNARGSGLRGPRRQPELHARGRLPAHGHRT